MRDAYGGIFMLEIMMIFVVIIVGFTAAIFSVARAFRVKNEIINYVEQYDYSNNADNTIAAIDSYLNKVGYYVDSSVISNCSNKMDRGYCLEAIDDGSYYKVTTYVSVSLPFFKLHFTIPISGESKSVVTLSD